MSTFFSSAELERVIARDGSGNITGLNSSALATLYSNRLASFKTQLGGNFSGLPADYYKAAFSSVLAYELKPYKGTTAVSLTGLLSAEGLHCGNYSMLTRYIFSALAPGSSVDVTMIGWTGGTVGAHSQLLIASTDKPTLLLDGTIGLVVRLDGGYNELAAGIEVAPENIASFRSRDELESFYDMVLTALTEGEFQGGQSLYWYEVTDYYNHYQSYSYSPNPQNETDALLSVISKPNRLNGSTARDVLVGGGAGDRITGKAGKDLLIGGRLEVAGDPYTDRGMNLQAASFFTAAEIAQIIADPSNITDLYASRLSSFRALLRENGSEFSSLPADYYRLAFAAALAYDMKSYGDSSATSLSELLADDTLDADGYALLAWNLFLELTPSTSPNVAMVEWNSDTIGHHVQLLIASKGYDALLVDPTLAHFALTSGYNALTSGEAIGENSQRSLAWRSENEDLRCRVISSLEDGLTRAGDLLAWYNSPEEYETENASRNSDLYWGTPQDLPYWEGTNAAATIGTRVSTDFIDGGTGADVLIGDGVVRSEGAWASIGTRAYSWTVGDFDGDGKDDLLAYDPIKGLANTVYLSTGTDFESDGRWTGFGPGKDGWYVGDFNGDGRDDVMRYLLGVSGGQVFLSNGDEFIYDGSWTSAGYGKDGWYVGDFNGDGRDDVMRYLPGVSGGQVFLSDGDKFVYDGSWTGFGHGNMEWLVQDVDGDGLVDLIGNSWGTAAGSYVLKNTGSSFIGAGWSAAGNGPCRFALGDFDGDGKGDLALDQKNVLGVEVLVSTGFDTGDDDRFILNRGETAGDVIADFEGASVAGGDVLWFSGFGTSDQISLTHKNDYWTIANSTLGVSETFRIVNVTSLSANDYVIV